MKISTVPMCTAGADPDASMRARASGRGSVRTGDSVGDAATSTGPGEPAVWVSAWPTGTAGRLGLSWLPDATVSDGIASDTAVDNDGAGAVSTISPVSDVSEYLVGSEAASGYGVIDP